MKTEIRFIRSFFCLFFITFLLLACSKDGQDGAIGPQGAQGEQGPAGPQGETGEPGPSGPQGNEGNEGPTGADGQDGSPGEQGETGTANVIYSNWFNTELGNAIGLPNDSFDVDFPDGTFSVLSEGVVLVFGRRIVIAPFETYVYQLPITFSGTRQQIYSFLILNGDTLRITVESLDAGAAGDGTYIEQYRWVAIPGGVPSAGKSASSADYTKMSYEEIAAHFNIPE
ncbi:hypothetical protein [Maribacter halichondriae]|uniref:hypothetical protein n=1 Tax=Maribacter halichondriae TaxID=2980554 RepID=UPI002358B304|nr:hypothetical protein [Maribacter sp. Hal144]